MRESVDEYYIVSVETREPRGPKRLAWISEVEGFSSHDLDKRGAKRFSSKPSTNNLKKYSGMPWWFVHIPNTYKIYKVVERHEITEELIDDKNHA